VAVRAEKSPRTGMAFVLRIGNSSGIYFAHKQQLASAHRSLHRRIGRQLAATDTA
jgi:hypothetical protein